MKTADKQFIHVCTRQQKLYCFENDHPYKSFAISSGKKGVGEQYGSERTPRGWHRIYSKIGLDAAVNSVFIARQWTGEIYTPFLAQQFPERDWILTRILQLDGLEEGRNKGGDVDSLRRCIYIHGTPDTTILGQPGSHGCIRMRNRDLIELSNWVLLNTKICIE